MSLRRYEVIKDIMKRENVICKLMKECGEESKIPDAQKVFKREIRKALRDIDRDYCDQLQKPITKAWRRIVPDKDDIAISGYDYRILISGDPDDWTDEEIEEYIMDEVGYPPICEPWDCTGKRFTRWCSWSRQPIGIVMIHAWGTDL